MTHEERAHIERLLAIHRASLRELEVQAATFGDLHVPVHVKHQIAEHQGKITELEARMAELLPLHNLPPRDYERFVGRQNELAEVRRLLSPRSRAFVITIDGIGGIGKSALALEAAYSFCDGYAALPAAERFDAIVWVSAKRSYLTADGILERRQAFRTLDDLYTAIAQVLDFPAITRARAAERRAIVEQVLGEQRTLLILDNLETVDDEDLLVFLRELPAPTKAIVTTRHRIDVAHPVRLTGMRHEDALALIDQEAARKAVALSADEREQLWLRTGGVPLAIVWSIGLMGLGGSVESILRRLGSGQSDIARFCFEESVAQIRGRDAYTLLVTLALFEGNTSRTILGEVAGFSDDVFGRDEGLAELLRLSLVNKEEEQYNLLPLTRSYLDDELEQQPVLAQSLQDRRIAYFIQRARVYSGLHWEWYDYRSIQADGQHFLALADWSIQSNRLNILPQILPAVSYYYDLLGQWSDILALSRIALDYAILANDLESIAFIENYVFGWILSQQGHHQEAEQSFLNGLSAAEQLGDVSWQCAILSNYSQACRRIGAFEQALAQCQKALDLIERLSEPRKTYVRADIEYELSKIARDRGEWQNARSLLLNVREVFRYDDENSVFNPYLAWGILNNFGFVAYQLGDFDEAARIYQQCFELYGQNGSTSYRTTLLVRAAYLEDRLGHTATAMNYAREALGLSRKLGMVQELSEAEALLARLGATP